MIAAPSRWPEIDTALCEGCGECLAHCPTGALALVGGRAVVLPGVRCEHCADCEAACPRGAIRCAYEIVFAEQETALTP